MHATGLNDIRDFRFHRSGLTHLVARALWGVAFKLHPDDSRRARRPRSQ